MDKIQVPITFNLQKRSAYKRHSTYENHSTHDESSRHVKIIRFIKRIQPFKSNHPQKIILRCFRAIINGDIFAEILFVDIFTWEKKYYVK